MTLVLIVDDIAAMREQYAYDLKRLGGFGVAEADGGRAGLDALETQPVDCMILDLEMPDMDGFQVLAEMKRRGLKTPVIVYTGTGSYDRCTRAVKMGAHAFMAKDEPLERVVAQVEHAVEFARLQAEVARLQKNAGHDSPLLGDSRAMQDLREGIDQLASIPSTVLVLGDRGTGKALVARQLHDRGPRARHPFVAVNCASLPDGLAESELFGHEKGAFTGADRIRRGAFESAHRGTLFLDEVGELPAPAQAKLLRVLETSTISRVGSHAPITVDVRVVAATHRDLDREVAEGRFREDLLYRLNVHVLRVPPLRERLSDIPLLADHFAGLAAEQMGRPARPLTDAARARLAGYDWRRNNVRELRNVLERMVLAARGEVIDVDVVPADIGPAVATGAAPAGGDGGWRPGLGTLQEQREAADRAIIQDALDRHDGHVTNTAHALGLADHSSLLKIMRRLGLKR